MTNSNGADYTINGNVLIDPSAQIGRNCVIGPNAIGPNCVIGEGVRITRSAVFEGA